MYDYTELYQRCDKILDYMVNMGGRIMRSDLNGILPKDSTTHVALQHLLDDKCIQENPKGSSYYDIISNGTRIQGNGGYKEEFNRLRLADELRNVINQSILDTNTSVKETNKSVRSTNYWIKRTAIIGTVIAFVTLLFIGLDYYKTTQKTEKIDISPLTNQLKESQRLLDSIRKYQKGIEESLRTLENDSTKSFLIRTNK